MCVQSSHIITDMCQAEISTDRSKTSFIAGRALSNKTTNISKTYDQKQTMKKNIKELLWECIRHDNVNIALMP